ncbi:hypothetical protein RvY_03842 [Ramazzottius varieornatus]|uniref:HTH CENPB-type domain-containing protein n=1 Tax=Ramazzottius varieornatus TaxID=947166 RepID=A0A1D1UPG0_RAMVA|nr:hypothetical protein RvY_03842 [Ramazzottius varieornatus]
MLNVEYPQYPTTGCTSTKDTLVSNALFLGMNEAKFTDRWHRKFLRRNREISSRILSAVSFKKSRELTRARCEHWISLLQKLSDNGFLDDADGIWNLDESGFRLTELFDKERSTRREEWRKRLGT